MFKQKFANNIKKFRKSKGMTQERLADLVNVDFRYISLIENAKSFPSCDVIEKLAKALDVEYSQLFFFEENLSREELEQSIIKIIKTLNEKNLKTLFDIAKILIR